MKRVSNVQKDEFRKLSKKTKEKNELDRLKREVGEKLVQLGVTEREKMDQVYSKFRLNLQVSHDELLKHFNEKKMKVCREYYRVSSKSKSLKIMKNIQRAS